MSFDEDAVAEKSDERQSVFNSSQTQVFSSLVCYAISLLTYVDEPTTGINSGLS